ncbi:hypothetical protein A3I27_00250 [Candidatus Giovannonibacteria bacterium RIFCSPLOWO2_02_FULL_43_11b]|uniref:Type IV secretion system coupling protein TraD DNA-binding domain-containing protein n=1 Tax=Candidatus Giovannonibacteria bacterium RIFCSPHIGHO2_12_FULL_43_15 TaxID=1798341 RepID=A0A1F5WQF6_9BACT|nr:MAG: hypothetical protein A2739_02165 [Candidatus Giovannonibacteria bacterium RIFCSPHIGHO2_01_FULL_43_100]OGF66991.1 MAG: hypothetical protein A3B97_00120 [Candidatus Giovannonibacteria bacterium RIFCSPHIGHO2_02_FULL_43_32]OGF77913.1 MAG: hypothetical protein A3F23_04245 [Candidatus Giovannonibacteria bacterium RIFCSPHIGHO2_12_FULL_43_15]OGF78688.1 MAG: hypothetical protein A3A15_01920 [Candidatus Giovannonibacteria bacterium RIFCSPLOWO2_01_FULL_43_60]OGF89413.1 MAG: hypothetical protein A3
MSNESKVQIITHAPPPPDLPVYQRVDPKGVNFFGRTNYVAALEEKRFIFGIKRGDRRRHMYIVGKSGVGKSKLLELLIRQDIAYGHGVCLIDPHGDVIQEILNFVPENRINDVVLIDPSDTKFPVSFNPLDNVHPDMKHQFTQGLIEVMEKQFGANWTPRLEHVFRFTTLALLDYPAATMRGMISMLTDREYRQRVVDYITDDMVKRFWAVEFADWSEKFDTEAIIPLVNKLGQFLSDPLLRNIFAQRENKIDLEKIMNEGKILLINLSKGRLGEENSSFFGSMFITKIKQAGMARASLPEKERTDFYLYVDEFHNLVTNTFENIFSEARKYGLCLIVAHQYMSQLLPAVQATVLGNSGTLVVFRIGGDDAKKLESEMTPIFKAKDMINLGMQEFYIKMTIDGNTYDPFSAETLKIMPATHGSFKEKILKFSRDTYAIPVDEVKRKLEEEEKELLFGKKGKPAEGEEKPDASLPAADKQTGLPSSKSAGGEGPSPMV